MKLSALGEFGLIDKIRNLTVKPSPSVLIGIGDDAAVLKIPASASLLATTDMLIEGVHFDLAYTDFYSLGWKSAAANLSDIAAMGGSPRFCLISLGIPPTASVEQISEFYRGLNGLLAAHRTALVGGDTCSSPRAMTVSVTLLGEIERKNVISREGAKPGDRIFVTGTLGDSAAGLELLRMRNAECGFRNGKSEIKKSKAVTPGPRGKGFHSAFRIPHSALIMRHLRPEPRVAWGRKLALSRCVNAMIDVSDGLSSDLSHICGQSGVGAIIEAEKVPVSAPLRKAAGRLGHPPLHYALSGGEDYELLFTSPPSGVRKLRSLGIPVVEIGEIIRARKMMIVDGRGKTSLLAPTGYNHFAHASRRKAF